MPNIKPEMLIWAREAAGLSVDEAAKKLGFKDSGRSTAVEKLNIYEQGQESPERSLLVKMAHCYRRSLLIFYMTQPPRRGKRGQDFRTIMHPELQGHEANLDLLIRDINLKQSLVKSVLEDEEAQPLNFVASSNIREDISTFREKIIREIGFKLSEYRAQSEDKAFIYLRNKFESIGIFVLLLSNLGTHHSSIPIEVFRGFASSDSLAPFIVINDQDTKLAKCFTLLHEAAHIWLGTTGISNSSCEGKIEKFCNDIASQILLPQEDLDEFPSSAENADDLCSAITSFAESRNINRALVAYRLLRTRRINNEMWVTLNRIFLSHYRQTKAKLKEERSEEDGGPNFYVVKGNKLGRALLSLTSRALNNGQLSYTKAAQLLGVKARSVQPFLNNFSGRL